MKLFKKYGDRPYVRIDFNIADSLMTMTNTFIKIANDDEKYYQEDFINFLTLLRTYYFQTTERDLFKDTEELLARKSQDYNAERVNSSDFQLDDMRIEYFPFGYKSYIHMIFTKVERIRNLSKKNGEPNFEGIKDSIIDAAAYLSFMYSYFLFMENNKSGN